MRSCLWLHSEVVLLVLFGLLGPDLVRAEGACGASGRPWVSVDFTEGVWSEGLREATYQDLKAGLASRQIDTCRAGESATSAAAASIHLTSRGADSVLVTVEIRDAVTEKKVSRDIDLAAVPTDGRAFAMALGADELVWASWAEIALKGHARQTPAPPELVVAVRQSLPARIGEADRLGLTGAFEHFTGGQTHLGPDVSYLHPWSDRLRLRLSGGFRRGLIATAPDGSIRSTSIGLFMGPEILVVRRRHFELGATLGGRAAWVHFVGEGGPDVLGRAYSGFSAALCTGIHGAVHFGGPFWGELGAGAGWVLRAIEATDAGQVQTGVSGLQLSTTLSLLTEI